jgi:hypothetical protein
MLGERVRQAAREPELLEVVTVCDQLGSNSGVDTGSGQGHEKARIG